MAVGDVLVKILFPDEMVDDLVHWLTIENGYRCGLKYRKDFFILEQF